jgi:hypothetical protein
VKWVRDRLATILFVVAFAVVLGFIGYSQWKTHENQIDSCERGNVLRRVLSNNEAVQYDFLTDAIRTRENQAAAWKRAGNLQQYRINHQAAERYREDRARLQKVQETDCQMVVR